MADQFVIRADNISKKFCRNLKRSLWYGMRDIGNEILFRQPPAPVTRADEFWALKGISFELGKGEALGILGQNGAGKSTLLKLMIGRLKPTTGRITTQGKLAAITELGLGFNPVMSGRENIFLNAAMLGMPRAETNKILDKIVNFASIGKFIDSPVQTYSTGMRARLGYAVAAHLNPEALLIDEVLAVGDISFRRKCMQHIREYLDGGGTLLFVSHDLWAVQSICTQVIVLKHGEIIFSGATIEGIKVYFESQNEHENDLAVPNWVKKGAASSNGEHGKSSKDEPAAENGKPEAENGKPKEDAAPVHLVEDLGPGASMEDLTRCLAEGAALELGLGEQSAATGSEELVQRAAQKELQPTIAATAEETPTEELAPAQELAIAVAEAPPEPSTAAPIAEPRASAPEAEFESNVSLAAPLTRGAKALNEEHPLVVESVRITGLDGGPLVTNAPCRVTVAYRALSDLSGVRWGFSICTTDLLVSIASGLFGFDGQSFKVKKGAGEFRARIDRLPLHAGQYALRVGIGDCDTGIPYDEIGWRDSPFIFSVQASSTQRGIVHGIIGDLIDLHVTSER